MIVMILYVMRHGETDYNKARKLQGKHDIPLNENGIELAKITAAAIKDIPIDVIYSSPLTRAITTAEIIREGRTADIIIDNRLEEMGFGVLEGVAKERIPEDFFNFFNAPEKYVPAEGGETFEAVIKRAQSFIDDVVIPNSAKYESMMIVAHGSMNNAIALILLHRELKDYWDGPFPKNCSISSYEINGGNFELIDYAKKYY